MSNPRFAVNARSTEPQRIAVVGSGIAGLSCAWLLAQQHDVTLFEKDDRFGGHSNTVVLEGVDDQPPLPVDTGFIVFNPQSYPNLVALFEHLEVPVRATDMSFSVSINQGQMEYAGSDLTGLLAQSSNLLRPGFWRMLADILRFYRQAPQLLNELDDQTSLGQLIEQYGYGRRFRDDHLLPMGAAIWSTPASQMLDYPAKTFLRFCANHGLLQLRDRPQWMTVEGGSREYVERLVDQLGERAVVNRGVRSIQRTGDHVLLTDWQGQYWQFDQLVLACHADQSLKLLSDADQQEQALLQAFKFERNRALLHSDERLMPLRKRAWASWNYLCRRQSETDTSLSVSYWMNRLQGLPEHRPLFVTLNPLMEPDPERVHAAFLYDHPTFDASALQAQRELWHLQGHNNTWYCGAWCGYGFHEDGLQAGLAVAEALGQQRRPWQVDGMYDRIPLPQNWFERGTAAAAKQAGGEAA
ncbi:NAD(P)/FAD-dependent oxidoreductase [Motiliproteus sp.]|uniref:NAD(P)/FAD-dependent oxidoreductase n=1 Tax=Motiliproteus sp. TaxID=1898955 RepID=UPI003BAA8834